jgi:hypothetical protein
MDVGLRDDVEATAGRFEVESVRGQLLAAFMFGNTERMAA